MRWLLAALSFGVLVGLAVSTAATRAASLELRLRLESIEFGRITYGIERQRRARELQAAVELDELRRRWLAVCRLQREEAPCTLQ